MEFRGTGRKIYDGSETGIPYLHGVVVREDFAKQYPEIVVAFIEAIYEAGEWIKADPMRAVELMEKWSGVEKEVLYLYFSKGGYLTLDPTIKPAWVDALKFDHQVLVKENVIRPLDFDNWITEILRADRLQEPRPRLRRRARPRSSIRSRPMPACRWRSGTPATASRPLPPWPSS